MGSRTAAAKTQLFSGRHGDLKIPSGIFCFYKGIYKGVRRDATSLRHSGGRRQYRHGVVAGGRANDISTTIMTTTLSGGAGAGHLPRGKTYSFVLSSPRTKSGRGLSGSRRNFFSKTQAPWSAARESNGTTVLIYYLLPGTRTSAGWHV